MANPLLEIELVHYVVILIWIPLLIHIEKKTSDWIKNLTHVGFGLAWLSIVWQLLFKIWLSYDLLYVSSKFYIAYSWKILFNFSHLFIVLLLFIISIFLSIETMKKDKSKDISNIPNSDKS